MRSAALAAALCGLLACDAPPPAPPGAADRFARAEPTLGRGALSGIARIIHLEVRQGRKFVDPETGVAGCSTDGVYVRPPGGPPFVIHAVIEWDHKTCRYTEVVGAPTAERVAEIHARRVASRRAMEEQLRHLRAAARQPGPTRGAALAQGTVSRGPGGVMTYTSVAVIGDYWGGPHAPDVFGPSPRPLWPRRTPATPPHVQAPAGTSTSPRPR
jgi:hypothetical protein